MGRFKILLYFPLILGHENAGYVEEMGEKVKREIVVIYGGWSERLDRFGMKREENLTDIMKWVGVDQRQDMLNIFFYQTICTS